MHTQRLDAHHHRDSALMARKNGRRALVVSLLEVGVCGRPVVFIFWRQQVPLEREARETGFFLAAALAVVLSSHSWTCCWLFGFFLGQPMAAGAPCGAERDESAEEEDKKKKRKHSAEDDVRDEEERRRLSKKCCEAWPPREGASPAAASEAVISWSFQGCALSSEPLLRRHLNGGAAMEEREWSM